MKHGNWVPISKFFTKFLPLDRELTELEAAYSLQVDCDNKADVTVAGCASRWRWSRGRVLRFFETMGVKILYAENTKKKQNQRGQIVIQITDRKRTDNGQIRLIENSNIETETDRKRTDNGQITDRSRYTTIDPNTNPKPKETTLVDEEESSTVDEEEKSSTCPHQQIIFLYNKILPDLPRVIEKLWNGSRMKNLRMRWREDPERQNLQWWEDLFIKIKKSAFLTGDNDINWTADMGWIVKRANMVRIIEGKYNQKNKNNGENEKW